jgi:solute carrier family 25 uncoupling protein 8/9
VTQPADTIKTLVMARADGFGTKKNENVGAWGTARALVAKSGPAALYRGFWPAAARQGPVMVIQMPIVEQFRKAMGLEYF